MKNDETTRAVYHDVVIGEMNTDKIRHLNREMVATFRSLCPDFLEWIGELSRFGGNPIDAMVLWEGPSRLFKARFFTGQFEYTITAREGWAEETAADEGYLGAVVSNRRPRAGEDWTRGDDLADGSYSAETWHRIMVDIISHEMVRLGK
jgi:hypothetical protein